MRSKSKLREFEVLRRLEIERLARAIDVADTVDFHTFLIAWQWHNKKSKDLVGSLMEAATRMGGDITEEQAEKIIQEAATARQRRSADALARFLGLIYKMRTALGITTIGSIDIDKRQRAKIRKERARVAEQYRRRARGAKPRSESALRKRPWKQDGVGRSTYYKRKRAEAAGGLIRAQPPLTPKIGLFRAQPSVSRVYTKQSTRREAPKQEAAERGLATAGTAKPKPAVFVEGAVRHVPCGTDNGCHESVQQRSRR